LSDTENRLKELENRFSADRITVNFLTQTEGDGLWSGARKKVRIIGLSLNDAFDFKVYFLTEGQDSWDPYKDGLIYTDEGWLRSLRANLKILGFSDRSINSIDYSEQGMQGDDFVSLDADDPFIKEFCEKYNVEVDNESLTEFCKSTLTR
jgi:hypothetical protein